MHEMVIDSIRVSMQNYHARRNLASEGVGQLPPNLDWAK